MAWHDTLHAFRRGNNGCGVVVEVKTYSRFNGDSCIITISDATLGPVMNAKRRTI